MAGKPLLLTVALAVSCGTHADAGDLLGTIVPGHCSTCVRNHTVVPVFVPMPVAQPSVYGRPATVVRQVPGRPPEPVPRWARPYGTVPVIAIQEPAPGWANVDPSALAVNSLRYPASVAQPYPTGVRSFTGQPQPVQGSSVSAYGHSPQTQPVAVQSQAAAQMSQPVGVAVRTGNPAAGAGSSATAFPSAMYARSGVAVPVAAPMVPQAAVRPQHVAAPAIPAAVPTNQRVPMPVAPQTRQIKLFNDDTSKPPPGTLGRTYMRPTRMVPWDTHPRVGMLDVEILDTMRQGLARDVKIKVHAEDMYGNFKPLEGYRGADGIWHFESDPLLPTVPHIYNVHFELIREEMVEEIRYGRRFQRLVERNLGSLGVRRIRLIPGRIVDLIFY
ncbi:MAG: hypothetical protein VB858_15545 [Planctomycetaceae bacterium]